MRFNRRNFLLGSGIGALGILGFSEQSDCLEIGNFTQKNNPIRDTINSCRPSNSLEALMQGNQRFVRAWQQSNAARTTTERASIMSSLWLDHCFLTSSVLENEQAPWATVFTCADSRVSPEWIFNTAPSDLFVIRSAGNTAFDAAIASIEYSVTALKSPLIMVMGHSNCGAVKAARQSEPLPPLLEELIAPIRANIHPNTDLEQSIKENTWNTTQQLIKNSELLASASKHGSLKIITSYFDIESGNVYII